jgi:hypothetical protein
LAAILGGYFIMATAPMKYAERTTLGQHLIDEDHDLLVDMYRGFSPVGTFVSPYTYVISKNIVAGVTYYCASNAFQPVYGGATLADHHNGGVDGVDGSAVIQACLDVGTGVSVFIKDLIVCNTALTISYGGTTLLGAGESEYSGLYFNDCHGLIINANQVTIHDLLIEQADYDKTKTGIKISGTHASAKGYCALTNLKVWGWGIAVQIDYTWNSLFSSIDTTFSYTGLYIYGQSINNEFSTCNFSNAGVANATVLIERDAGEDAHPEGNNFVNCMVYGGTIGFHLIFADYIQIGTGCNVDGWSTVGVYIVDCVNTAVGFGTWIGSATASQICVKIQSSDRTGIIGANLYNTLGTGVYLCNSSTSNRINDNDIVAGTGIEEAAVGDNYNIFVGNIIDGPGVGSHIVVRGANSVRSDNIPATG